MAGNVLIGICSASLATVLAADKIQVMTQVRCNELVHTYSTGNNGLPNAWFTQA